MDKRRRDHPCWHRHRKVVRHAGKGHCCTGCCCRTAGRRPGCRKTCRRGGCWQRHRCRLPSSARPRMPRGWSRSCHCPKKLPLRCTRGSDDRRRLQRRHRWLSAGTVRTDSGWCTGLGHDRSPTPAAWRRPRPAPVFRRREASTSPPSFHRRRAGRPDRCRRVCACCLVYCDTAAGKS